MSEAGPGAAAGGIRGSGTRRPAEQAGWCPVCMEGDTARGRAGRLQAGAVGQRE